MRSGIGSSGRGSPSQAVTVFRINTAVYPHSANAFDSLGEALVDDGAARRGHRCLPPGRSRSTPGFPPSQQALQRLGVEP